VSNFTPKLGKQEVPPAVALDLSGRVFCQRMLCPNRLAALMLSRR
jgi:hypothetical protein